MNKSINQILINTTQENNKYNFLMILGQFGQVFKAKQIRNNQQITVAVKTLRSNPERIDVENLMSELKIMIHLGKFLLLYTLSPNFYHAPSSVWSKTTVITGSVGGAGVEPSS